LEKEIPPIEDINWELSVYDPVDEIWRRGRRTIILIPEHPVHLVWTNTGVDTDVKPDLDKEIDVLYANRIAIQIDTTHPSNTSTDIDINVESTLDGANWDTIPYAERNIGDAQKKTFLVEVSVQKIRLRLDNNDSATTGYVTARVLVVK
jgi:hypothetical protein